MILYPPLRPKMITIYLHSSFEKDCDYNKLDTVNILADVSMKDIDYKELL